MLAALAVANAWADHREAKQAVAELRKVVPNLQIGRRPSARRSTLHCATSAHRRRLAQARAAGRGQEGELNRPDHVQRPSGVAVRRGWISTRSATRRQHWFLPTKNWCGFPILEPPPSARFPGDKVGSARRILSPFNDWGGCTSPQNSGGPFQPRAVEPCASRRPASGRSSLLSAPQAMLVCGKPAFSRPYFCASGFRAFEGQGSNGF